MARGFRSRAAVWLRSHERMAFDVFRGGGIDEFIASGRQTADQNVAALRNGHRRLDGVPGEQPSVMFQNVTERNPATEQGHLRGRPAIGRASAPVRGGRGARA
jgi:hypothetical protein